MKSPRISRKFDQAGAPEILPATASTIDVLSNSAQKGHASWYRDNSLARVPTFCTRQRDNERKRKQQQGGLISFEARCPVHGKYRARLSTCSRRSALFTRLGKERVEGFWRRAKLATRYSTAVRARSPAILFKVANRSHRFCLSVHALLREAASPVRS